MVTKTLTITEEAYNSLKEHKAEGESFSQTVMRITRKKGLPIEFFGMTKNDPGFRQRMQKNRIQTNKDWNVREEKLWEGRK